MKIAKIFILALIDVRNILAWSGKGSCANPKMIGEIRNSKAKTQCVDANGSGAGDVGTYKCEGGSGVRDQTFKFCEDGTIRSTKSGLCLTKEGQKFVKMSNCMVDPTVSKNQSWKIAESNHQETDSGILQSFFFLRNRDDGNHCLDIAGNSGHGDIVTYRCQFWLADQRFYVRSRGKAIGHGKLLNQKSNKCIDVPGRHGYGNIATYRCQDLADQVFTMYENGELVNAESQQCVSVANTNGRGNVQIDSCYGTKFQQWKMESFGGTEDYFFLKNKDSGLCIDVAGDSGEGEIATSPCEHLQDQYWKWIAQEEITPVGTYEKCQAAHPHCSKCSWLFTYCYACESPFVKVDGKCATPINFDDISVQSLSELNLQVPNGYHNLKYENLYFMNSELFVHSPRDSGYVHGTVSRNNVAYTGYAQEAFIRASEGKTFSVCSMNMTPAWKENVIVWIGGYNSNGLVASKKLTLNNPCITEHIELEGFENLTELMICPWGGESIHKFEGVTYSSAAYKDGTGAHVVIDNLIVY